MLSKMPMSVILIALPTLLAFTALSGCSDSTVAEVKKAEYRIPNSDIRLTMTIEPDEKARVIRASDGEQEFFKTKLNKNSDGKTHARLYKNKETYTLVDSSGDRYLLNMREKHFAKSADSKTAADATYVGKFDFDKKRHWRFIPSKQLAKTEDSSSQASSSSSLEKRQFGPPSKHFR